ncbi:MAG TPA: metal-sulfur cluster assembly factor [Hanamia sp.]|nr:metal-sulfur cluster assembly factor [Hanamia sp.]
MNEITNDKAKCELALGALKFVDDPEIGLNVVDLGLIYQIDFDEDQKKIFCAHSLTTQFCPMGETINNGVTNALQQTFPLYIVETKITFDPPWNSSKISDEGREFLNM